MAILAHPAYFSTQLDSFNPNSHGLLNVLFPLGGIASASALGTIVYGLLFLPNGT